MAKSDQAVFLSLKEAFPQVDVRILRATALEHYNDIDEAANFILTDVLPHLREPLRLHHPDENNNPSPQDVSNKLHPSPKCRSKESQASFSTGSGAFECQEGCNSESEVECSSEYDEDTFSAKKQEVAEQEECSTAEKSRLEIESEAISNKNATDSKEVASVFTSNICSMQYDHLEGQGKSASFLVREKSSQYDLENDDPILVTSNDKEVIVDPATVATQSGKFLNMDVSGSNSCSTFFDDPAIMHSPALVLHTNTASQENGQPVKNIAANTHYSEREEISQLFPETGNGDLLSNVAPSVNDENCSTSGARSDQILNVDVLANFLNDAKTSKHSLLSAMETIVSLVKEAETLEEEAEQEKEQSLRAGSDIIAKTEDLKKKIEHARETNERHSGELYGEKSILASEARELQSRLLGLAGERDKTLSMIEEMRATLEARITAAEADIVAAKNERLDAEERALQLLKEQENMMDEMAEESRRLQQLVEENSKLRGFLVDRGRIVDTLQGEISVICEDIVSLKASADGHVPFVKFLHSNPTSLTSSMRSALSEGGSEQEKSSDKSMTIRKEPLENQEAAGSVSMEPPVAADHGKIASDEWEFFEDYTVTPKNRQSF